MNLTDLFKQQRILDAEIERKHPKQPGEDRLAKKLLALSVELGECANEWRGFKFWSNRQTPNTLYQTTCDPDVATHHYCEDCKEDIANKDILKHFKKCEGILYPMRAKNPLLEEYIDCLHFALSIGNDYTDRHGEGEETSAFLNIFDYLDDEEDEYLTESIVLQFNGIYNFIGLLSDKTSGIYSVEHALDACAKLINNVIGLGEMLGFTWQDIVAAYEAKNEINHTRQAEGY